MDHFFAKIAGVKDAPNYGPTASDDRCETCSYFRATNDGAGYCERFSFEAEPESVCDDFVAAGRMKTSSAPSVYSRLTRFAKSPTGRRVGASMAAGAVSGAGVGAFGAGEEKGFEALKGAIVGATVGGLVGGSGPAYRSMLKRKAQAASQPLVKDGFEVLRLRQEMVDIKAAPKVLNSKSGSKQLVKLKEKIDEILKKYPGSNNDERLKYVAKKAAEVGGDFPRGASKKEVYGAPALSALVSGGLGFGLSHRSKEQEKYRRSKK